MGWNSPYQNGEKKYYKPIFDFPKHPTTSIVTLQPGTESATQEKSALNNTIDDIVTSVKESVTEFISEQSTTPLTAEEITQSSVIQAVTTANSTIIEEMANVTIIQDAITTTTETLISTDVILGVEEAGTTMLNEALDDPTTISDLDWMHSGTEDMFFNHNLTMSHEEFEESSQKLYIMLGLILGVLVIMLIFAVGVYNKYRKTNVYEMQEGCPVVQKHRVISKTSETCYGNESVLIESNEVENYKF